MTLPSLLILQPTPFCNLNCTYCYLPDRGNRASMSDDVLFSIAKNVLAPIPQSQRPVIVWHAGEPMTLRPGWYQKAFTILQENSGGEPLNHAFQTNGIGVSEQWLKLWSDWDVSVGVSLDGPAQFHDRRRKTRRGGGSFALTMKGIETLKSAGYPFHVITVLTADILPFPDLLVRFYDQHDLRNIAFNVEEIEGQAADSSFLSDRDSVAAYSGFLKRFYALADSLEVPVKVRELEMVRQTAVSPVKGHSRGCQSTALGIVTVGVDGSLSTYSPELLGVSDAFYNNFVFANVRNGGIDQILDNPVFRKLKSEVDAGVRACACTCGYFDVCGGGAPGNKYFEHGRLDGTETLFCQLTVKASLDAGLAHLEQRLGIGQSEPVISGGLRCVTCSLDFLRT